VLSAAILVVAHTHTLRRALHLAGPFGPLPQILRTYSIAEPACRLRGNSTGTTGASRRAPRIQRDVGRKMDGVNRRISKIVSKRHGAKGRADRGRRESEGGKEFADDYFASGGGFGGGKVGRR
jgi:hypothetical protein